MRQFPDNWTTANIKELFEFKYGKGLTKESRNSSGSVDVYGSNGVVGKHDLALTNGATIIIGRKGSVGEVNFSSKSCWAIDTTYYIDEFPCGISPQYWTLYLSATLKSVQDEKSSAIPGISREDIYKIEVPLPPLNEQQRIVAKLEKLLAKCEACKQRLDKIPDILKRFRQSILAAACSGRLTADWREQNPNVDDPLDRLQEIKIASLELDRSKKDSERIAEKFAKFVHSSTEYPDSWLVLDAECICDFITKGTTPKTELITESGEVPFLKVYHIVENKIDFYSVPNFIPREIHENFLKRSKVYPGDILMNIVGPPLNKVAIIPSDFPEWNINQALAIFRPVEGIVQEYLQCILSYEGTIEEVLRETRGIVGQSNISLEQCRNLQIPVPSESEQKEIVQRVEKLFKLADQIEQRYEKAKAYVDKLPQSILAKAFRGELVPQDPNDEPASVLLERIRAEREHQQSQKPKGNMGTSKKQRRKPRSSEPNTVQLDLPELESLDD